MPDKHTCEKIIGEWMHPYIDIIIITINFQDRIHMINQETETGLSIKHYFFALSTRSIYSTDMVEFFGLNLKWLYGNNLIKEYDLSRQQVISCLKILVREGLLRQITTNQQEILYQLNLDSLSIIENLYNKYTKINKILQTDDDHDFQKSFEEKNYIPILVNAHRPNKNSQGDFYLGFGAFIGLSEELRNFEKDDDENLNYIDYENLTYINRLQYLSKIAEWSFSKVFHLPFPNTRYYF